MTGLLLSPGFVATYRRELNEAAQRAGVTPDIIHLPDDAQACLAPADCDRIEVTMLTRDIRVTPHFKTESAE